MFANIFCYVCNIFCYVCNIFCYFCHVLCLLTFFITFVTFFAHVSTPRPTTTTTTTTTKLLLGPLSVARGQKDIRTTFKNTIFYEFWNCRPFTRCYVRSREKGPFWIKWGSDPHLVLLWYKTLICLKKLLQESMYFYRILNPKLIWQLSQKELVNSSILIISML